MTSASHSLRGIFPAFLTPLTRSGEIAEETTIAYLARLMDAGMDGVYVGGSTGEGMKLTQHLRMRLLETIMSALPPDKKIIVHVGSGEIEPTLKLAHHAAKTGAHAVSSLPPTGDSKAVFSFYERLAKESPLPLILYYFPMISPAAFPEEADLYRVCELPNVIGVKFTDYNLYLLQRLIDRGLLVYNGRDEVLGAGLLMGASGGIGSTFSLVPQEAIGIARAARAGDWPAVQHFQRSLNAVLNVLLQFPYLAAVKAACTMSYGLDFGSVLGEGFETPAQEDELMRQLASAIPSSGSDNKTTSFLSLR